MSAEHMALRDAIANLAAVQMSFQSDDDDGWRQRLVQRRRLLQNSIAAVAGTWQAVEQEFGRTDAGQRFRSALAQLRARVAEHQACWPAVSIDPADPGFIRSRQAMRASSADFHAAAAALLSPARPISERTPSS